MYDDSLVVHELFASKLRGLDGYEIVFICDDSGSMDTTLGNWSIVFLCSPLASFQEMCLDHFPKLLRVVSIFSAALQWIRATGSFRILHSVGNELERTVSIVVDLAATLDPDGVDIFFLNREPMRNVRSSEELKFMFSIPPEGNISMPTVRRSTHELIEGATPIVPIMRQILEEKREQIRERKLLLLIATDGEPTDFQGHRRIEEFRRALLYDRQPIDRIPVTIIACTGE